MSKILVILFLQTAATHVDLQREAHAQGLLEEYKKYKQTLATISTTIDYDYENELTVNKTLFPYPWHYNDEVMHKIVKEVWTENFIIGKNYSSFLSK